MPEIRNVNKPDQESTPSGLVDHNAPLLLCRSGVKRIKLEWTTKENHE